MEILEKVLTGLMLVGGFVLLAALAFIFIVPTKNNVAPAEVIRAHVPKSILRFFIAAAIYIIFVGGYLILLCWMDGKRSFTPLSITLISVFTGLFFGLFLFIYAYGRLSYVIADSEGLRVFRIFRKSKYYRYEEIGYFCDTLARGVFGELKGYDKNNKKIFGIEPLYLGATAVAQRLRERGIPEKSKNKFQSK